MQLWSFCEEKTVQLVRVAFFRSDFLQNPYFSYYTSLYIPVFEGHDKVTYKLLNAINCQLLILKGKKKLHKAYFLVLLTDRMHFTLHCNYDNLL